jgi:histidinol-phosphate phosphatase family protein
MTPAIFLDKDGTVLVDVPYNTDPALMSFEPGAPEALCRLARLQLPLIVVSNQPGVALGLFPMEAIEVMRRQLAVMFARAGARLDGFYCCPHHPQGALAAYAIPCACRKPSPGLLLRAADERGLLLASSWFIGDILDDVEAGNRAGCKTLLIDNGNETQWVRGNSRTPTLIAPDLNAASKAITSHMIVDRASDPSMHARQVAS